MTSMPGTVSKILWHFPGGPAWDAVANCQSHSPKPATRAYHALVGILKSGELRLGDFREVAKVFVPILKKLNTKTKKLETLRDQTVTLTSSPVCCLADIPIAHLSYHATRYGKMAIGFHRKAVVDCGFNPVLYSLETSRVMSNFRQGIGELELADIDAITNSMDFLESEISTVECEDGHEVDMVSAQSYLYDAKGAAEAAGASVSESLNSFRNTLAFVKTFKPDEFDTIYCEREWRCVWPFPFKQEDVAMIVLPKDSGGVNYFNQFITTIVPSIGLARSIPIVPWEDLIEH